jgi:glycosyltransferase involved in cell wall biosynthesis
MLDASGHNGGSTLLVLASTYPRWAGDPEPGFVHELCRRLAGRFRVIVVCPHAAGAMPMEVLDGVEIRRYRYAPALMETLVNNGGIATNLRRTRWKLLLLPGFVLGLLWTAWRTIAHERPAVAHAHWLIPQGLALAFLSLIDHRAPRFFVTSHGADLFALKAAPLQAMKRFVAHRAAAITVVSSAMRDEMVRLGIDVSQVKVRPMGVDMDNRYVPDSTVQRSRSEILFVGRLVEKKGVHHLLDAMPGVLSHVPDARLIIAGFGPEEAALKIHARSLGLDESVDFLGAIPQAGLPALYRRAALFVAPFVRAESGDEEGLGLVMLEAIGCGCPILAGNVSALTEVLGADFDGMTVNPRDTVALVGKIVDALADPSAAGSRAERLRATIKQKFDWSPVAEGYLRLAEEIAAG